MLLIICSRYPSGFVQMAVKPLQDSDGSREAELALGIYQGERKGQIASIHVTHQGDCVGHYVLCLLIYPLLSCQARRTTPS